MTEQEAKICIQGKLDCMNKCDVFNFKGTDECDNCKYCYLQGTFGEQKQAFEMAINALEEIQMYKDGKLCLIPADVYAKQCEELDAYKEIGTVEEIKQKLAELERWHTTEVNPKIKNVFANTSTQICHNCDHKDEYIEELEAEMEEYQAIGTPEECLAAVEKQKAKKPNYDDYHRAGYRCPTCNNVNPWGYKHCKHCGQKLDWRMKNEQID